MLLLSHSVECASMGCIIRFLIDTPLAQLLIEIDQVV